TPLEMARGHQYLKKALLVPRCRNRNFLHRWTKLPSNSNRTKAARRTPCETYIQGASSDKSVCIAIRGRLAVGISSHSGGGTAIDGLEMGQRFQPYGPEPCNEKMVEGRDLQLPLPNARQYYGRQDFQRFDPVPGIP